MISLPVLIVKGTKLVCFIFKHEMSFFGHAKQMEQNMKTCNQGTSWSQLFELVCKTCLTTCSLNSLNREPVEIYCTSVHLAFLSVASLLSWLPVRLWLRMLLFYTALYESPRTSLTNLLRRNTCCKRKHAVKVEIFSHECWWLQLLVLVLKVWQFSDEKHFFFPPVPALSDFASHVALQ